MKIFNKLALVGILLTGGLACTDLDEELKDTFTESFDPSNPGFGESENTNVALPNDGLNAAYGALRNGAANHGSYFSVSEVSTDEVVITQKGGDWFDGGIWLNMHRHDFLPTNPGLNGAWNDNYSGIFQCNALLQTGELSANQIAQVRAVRAYFYWRLMDLFGNIKIQLVPGQDVQQTSRQVAYDFIESELQAAIPDLEEARVYGRINRSTAYALLARLYLNSEVYIGSARWQDAIDAADMVINSGLYDLAPDFGDVFSPSNANNAGTIEVIYGIPFDESTDDNDDGTAMTFAQMTLHYPSQLTFDLQQQPWNGYSTLEEFYNSFEDTDARKEASFIVGPQTDLNGNPILDVAFDEADLDGAAVNYTPEINMLAPNGSRQAGARMGKYSFKIGQLPAMDNDYVLLRYGELLLVKAEAAARLAGNWSDATTLSLVNQLRTRAGVSEFTTLSEEEFLAERGREVFQESLRRTDLIRFGRWGDAWWEKPAHGDEFKNIMPIPLDQINAADPAFPLTQNTGY